MTCIHENGEISVALQASSVPGNVLGTTMIPSDSFMLQEFGPAQNNQSSMNSTLSSCSVPYYINDKQEIVTETLPTLRSGIMSPMPSLYSCDPQFSNTDQEMAAVAHHQCDTSVLYGKQGQRQNNVSPSLSHVSEEAMQLIQFCNHCTVDVGMTANNGSGKSKNGQAQNSALQNLSSSEQRVSGKSSLSNVEPNTCICYNHYKSFLFQGKKEVDSCYPFITNSTGDQNLTLSQINSGVYFTEPGTPRELIIKKYPLCKKKKSSCGRIDNCLDAAIKPFLYDSNFWWKKEYTYYDLNEDIPFNCVRPQCDKDTGKISESDSQRIRKTVTPSSITEKDILSLPATVEGDEQISSSNNNITKKSLRGKGMNKRKSHKGKIKADSCPDQHCASLDIEIPSCSKVKRIPTPTKFIEVCMNLCLIVSIPFRKLITDRQLKKYCEFGRKE